MTQIPDRTGWRWPLLIIALGTALRLMIAPLGAHPGDSVVLANWAQAAQNHGWVGMYTASSVNYPPLGALLVAASGLAPVGGRGWLILVKLPSILADAGIGLAALWMARDAHPRLRVQLAAGVAFNPALVMLSGWWGQLENVYAFGALLAALLARERRWLGAGAALGAAGMVKLQGLVVAPLLLLMLLASGVQRGDSRDTAPLDSRHKPSMVRSVSGLVLGVGAVVGMGMMPFALTGQSRLVAERSIALVAGPAWLTVNAANLWYLLTGGRGNWRYSSPLTMPDSAPLLAGVSARTLGLAALALWVVLVLWGVWRARRTRVTWWLGGTLLYLGIFLWPTQVHERYAFGAVVFAIGLAAECGYAYNDVCARWRGWLLYGMITLLHAANLLWAVLAGSQPAGLLLSVAQIMTAVWALAMLFAGISSQGINRHDEPDQPGTSN